MLQLELIHHQWSFLNLLKLLEYFAIAVEGWLIYPICFLPKLEAGAGSEAPKPRALCLLELLKHFIRIPQATELLHQSTSARKREPILHRQEGGFIFQQVLLQTMRLVPICDLHKRKIISVWFITKRRLDSRNKQNRSMVQRKCFLQIYAHWNRFISLAILIRCSVAHTSSYPTHTQTCFATPIQFAAWMNDAIILGQHSSPREGLLEEPQHACLWVIAMLLVLWVHNFQYHCYHTQAFATSHEICTCYSFFYNLLRNIIYRSVRSLQISIRGERLKRIGRPCFKQFYG